MRTSRALSPQKHMVRTITNISKIHSLTKGVHNAITLADLQIQPNSI